MKGDTCGDGFLANAVILALKRKARTIHLMAETSADPEKIPVLGEMQVKLPEMRVPGSAHGRPSVDETKDVIFPPKMKRWLLALFMPFGLTE